MNRDPIAIACAVAVIFACGFGWGKSFAERSIRMEQADLHKGRVSVSMPMREESASNMLGLLRDLMREVEKEGSAMTTNKPHAAHRNQGGKP